MFFNAFLFPLVSVACRNLLPSRLAGIRFGVPLQKLHPLSRAIHHRYSANTTPQRPPHRLYTSLSRLPVRPPRSRSGHGYQQQRSFWAARLAARLLKLRYILLGSAVGGGYTAKKVHRLFRPVKFSQGCKYLCYPLYDILYLVVSSTGLFLRPQHSHYIHYNICAYINL